MGNLDNKKIGRYCKQVEYELFRDTFTDYATHLISGSEAARRLGVDYRTFAKWAVECFTYGQIRRDFYFILGNSKCNTCGKRVLKNGKYTIERVSGNGDGSTPTKWES